MTAAKRTWSAEGMYLAFDTSTPLGSVCLGVNGDVIARRVIRGRGAHSSHLVPAIDAVLREVGADPSQLAGLVVGAGPGSVTGVRVAAATAKGLAHALDIPLWAVSSLEAGAVAVDIPGVDLSGGVDEVVHSVDGPEEAPQNKSVVLSAEELKRPRYVLFDARSDRVYAACYRPTGSGLEVLVPPHSTTIGEVLSESTALSVFMGDGAQQHEDEIRQAGLKMLPAPYGMPTAAALIRAVEDSPSRGPLEDIANWQPEYLRYLLGQRRPNGWHYLCGYSSGLCHGVRFLHLRVKIRRQFPANRQHRRVF